MLGSGLVAGVPSGGCAETPDTSRWVIDASKACELPAGGAVLLDTRGQDLKDERPGPWLQAVAVPIPPFLSTFANGMPFGWVWGAARSWISVMAGAALCCGLSRVLGRPAGRAVALP